MGLDATRVHGEVDEELICPICSSVLEDPLAAPECEHAFCRNCIVEWLGRHPTCPVDRRTVHPHELKPAPRILRNLLSRLEVKCENTHFGCDIIVKLDMLQSHLNECEHNPKRLIPCELGCDLTVPKDELQRHNCIRELRSLVRSQDQRITEIQHDLGDCKYQLAEQRREISILRDLVRNLRLMPSASTSAVLSNEGPLQRGVQLTNFVTQPASVSAHPNSRILNTRSNQQSMNASSNRSPSPTSFIPPCLPPPTATNLVGPRTVTNQIQDEEVVRWAASLPRARVTRWGGMISTPDAVLQSMIQRSLAESGCPDHIVNELMANAHERRWPAGLLTLETRQMNRRHYEQYVCRRIPNKQAVVVMACDNMHMSDDMILEPGLVMIFAHGIE